MDSLNRVLAFQISETLTADDIEKISGGSSKGTVDTTQRITGSYPGTTDAETDQVWD